MLPTERCSADLAELYDAIMAKMKGKAVSSAGAKGRSVSYSEAKLDDMIRLYRQLWAQCGAASGLPLLDEPGASTAVRGCIRARVI